MRVLPSPAASLGRFILLTQALAITAACDSTLVPLIVDDKYFSLYGVLDVTADTQWIRVMPIRNTVSTDPASIDAEVVLTLSHSDERIVLRDSLIRYQSEDTDVIADLWAHTFWTDVNILPDTVYELIAIRSDGATSAAVVRTPPFPTRVVISKETSFRQRDFLRVEGIEHIALAQLVFDVRECDMGFDFYYEHLSGSAVSSATFRPEFQLRKLPRGAIPCPLLPAGFYPDFRNDPIPGSGPIQWWDIVIVSSGTKWPFTDDMASGDGAFLDVQSNVLNGSGFVGGVARLQIPYDTCFAPPGSTLTCEVAYDRSSAVLEGYVSDSRCGGAPMKFVGVTIRADGATDYRYVMTDGRGYYRIGGLVPGVSYSATWEKNGYASEARKIVLNPGQITTFSVEMVKGACN